MRSRWLRVRRRRNGRGLCGDDCRTDRDKAAEKRQGLMWQCLLADKAIGQKPLAVGIKGVNRRQRVMSGDPVLYRDNGDRSLGVFDEEGVMSDAEAEQKIQLAAGVHIASKASPRLSCFSFGIPS